MRAPLGKFGVLGNHDHWAGAERVAARVAEGGVRLLGNSVCTLPLPGGGELMLGGCEDPWGRPRWRAPDAQGRPLMILAHTADNVWKLARCGALAVFAGHYHAGQGRLPWIGSVLVPSRYGRLFDHGHFTVGQTHLFVTAGVGCASPPVRIYCQPDITAVDFVPSPRATTD
jgi:predicted MPP superfamily phosphohydrolase